MGLFNQEQEKEVSSGAVIGYVLIGFAVVLVIAFLIFAATKKLGKDDSNKGDNPQPLIETEAETPEAEAETPEAETDDSDSETGAETGVEQEESEPVSKAETRVEELEDSKQE